jgi:hypothetical protein
MLIIGCDYHPGFQQIAFVDSVTGEFGERRLVHREAAEQFYQELSAQSAGVAQQVLPSSDAAGKQDRQGSHGTEAGGASVLDVPSGLRLRPDAQARFAGSKTLLSYSVDQGFDSIA